MLKNTTNLSYLRSHIGYSMKTETGNKMAKNEAWIIAGAIIAVALFLGQQEQPVPPAQPTTNGGIDLCKLVDGQASFTGQNLFLSGTALTSDYVRVIRQGSVLDLGLTSMDSGTLATTPNANYKLYFGENTTSGTRYTQVVPYNAPCQDATDDVVGVLCTVDTGPTITIFDENGQVQTNTANDQAMAANDITDIEIKVKASADMCYGNPDSPKKNAICFKYNSSAFDSVKANTPAITAPYSMSSNSTAKHAISCYELDLLADTGSQMLTITLDAASLNPNQNINVTIDDTAFDLNQDDLTEIWGFEDESNNNLGRPLIWDDIGIQIS